MSKNNEKKPSQEEINNLIQYYNDGDNNAAEESAIKITQKFPNHQLTWKILASVLKEKGEFSRSLEAGQTVIKIDPLDPEGFNNLGNTLRSLGRLDEAEENFKMAIEINPNYSDFHNNLGFTFALSGKLDKAIKCYKKAIVLKDNYALPYSNLGNVFKVLGRLEESEKNYRKAIDLDSNNSTYHTSLGLILRDFGKYEEAKDSYRKAIALSPKNSSANYHLGIVLFESRQYEEAAEHFELTDIAYSKSFALKCSYYKDSQSVFYGRLDKMINEGRVNAVIGSLSCRSEIRYGIKRSNPFCTYPLRYVLSSDLGKQYDFENTFVNQAKIFLEDKTLLAKSQGLLTNGYQTSGNLFQLKGYGINRIESIIRSEIEKYCSYYKGSHEGLIKKFPNNYSLHGWLVSMKSGGQLASHMHDNGWLSGSIYINIPPELNGDSGNLVVSIDDDHYRKKGENQKKSINLVTGSLCLFPSSLLHYTVPFESKEDRIVLAFDVIPI